MVQKYIYIVDIYKHIELPWYFVVNSVHDDNLIETRAEMKLSNKWSWPPKGTDRSVEIRSQQGKMRDTIYIYISVHCNNIMSFYFIFFVFPMLLSFRAIVIEDELAAHGGKLFSSTIRQFPAVGIKLGGCFFFFLFLQKVEQRNEKKKKKQKQEEKEGG